MDTAAFISQLFRSVPVADQIAVFDRQSWNARAKPFRRGDYCKVGLVLGTGRLHYANRGIAITRPALLFSNPLVPYSWEPLSVKQAGYFCLFTSQFVQAHYHNWTTQASPLFRLGADPVYFVDDAQRAYISTIYENMRRELSADYPGRYDLARHHLMLLMHEALKLQPATTYF
jgi:AraC family transcriptional regulator, transcriptional activator of pobA